MNKFKLTLLTLAVAALTGCAAVRPMTEPEVVDAPKVTETINQDFNVIPAPEGPPITVAVYNFKDLTGQRKPSNTLSLFSTAVTQGAEAYLMKTLMEAGNRQWFTVVERVGLDNLLKERQMIRQTREIYDGDKAKMLPPMTLAGVILEGGIIDYNSNTLTGGTGARWLGVGPYTQYTQDLVVISLRLVSVQSGEILTAVTVEKNLLSTSEGVTALRFFNQATQAFEFDSGQTFNEPGNYALRSAIEAAVKELVLKGERQGLWKFKEKPNELVQKKAPSEGAPKAPATPQKQPNDRKNSKGNQGTSQPVDGEGKPIRFGN